MLLDNGIKVRKGLHNAGEFMVTRSRGYHAGFNLGFNVAEAVNFALPRWLKVAKQVGVCTCANDSVSMNAESFMENLKRNKEGKAAGVGIEN